MKLIRYTYPNLTNANDIGSWFEDAFSNFARGSSLFDRLDNDERKVTPAADLYEDENHYFVRFDLPGVKRDELAITLENGVLTVAATRKENVEEKGEGTATGAFSFSRSISVPKGVVADGVKAALEDGVLTITLPKPEERKPRVINVS